MLPARCCTGLLCVYRCAPVRRCLSVLFSQTRLSKVINFFFGPNPLHSNPCEPLSKLPYIVSVHVALAGAVEDPMKDEPPREHASVQLTADRKIPSVTIISAADAGGPCSSSIATSNGADLLQWRDCLPGPQVVVTKVVQTPNSDTMICQHKPSGPARRDL